MKISRNFELQIGPSVSNEQSVQPLQFQLVHKKYIHLIITFLCDSQSSDSFADPLSSSLPLFLAVHTMFSANRVSFRTLSAPASAAAAALMLGSERKTAQHVSNRAADKLFWQSAANTRMLTPPARFSSTAVENSAKASGANKASTVAKTATSKRSKSFLQWYEDHLSERPLPTKMVTGSILWGIGDFVAQVVPQVAAQADGSDKDSHFVYYWHRTARAVIFGFGIHAPTAHLHYNFLEWMTVRVGATGLQIPIFKAFMEQFVYWSWVSNTLYHGAMGAMQGHSPTKIYQHIENVLWDTQKVSS